MARSDFNWGAEDWELFGPGKLKLYERGGMLYGSVRLRLRAPLPSCKSDLHRPSA